ncbi:MAG TPA: dolichyl-phosphate beta-glucosyltransferase [Gemmataceae bacterium]|nr:dolichyl-phosphate beta-glucosyltransferase [Gemmataceae bacterium]
MTGTPSLSLIVPAYNEARRITATLEAMTAYLDGRGCTYEILVGADGTDGTREAAGRFAAHDPRVQVYGDPERRGKGRAIRLGVQRARGGIIGFLDADYKTPIDEMARLLPWIDRGYDVVIGSRAVGDSRIEVPAPLHRRLGSRAFALGMRLIVGLWTVHDTQCGFKFFRGPVARDLFGRQRIDGYMFDVEVLYLAQRSGYRIREVGVRWRDDGDTRLQLVAGNWRNLQDLLRIRWAGLTAPRPAVQDREHREAA